MRVVATSSSTAELGHRRKESSVGRWEEIPMSPYLLSEARELFGLSQPVGIESTLAESLARAFERYLSYLEHSFLVFTLPNHARSEEAIQHRGRKLYFVDGAVRNAALQRGLIDTGFTGQVLLVTPRPFFRRPAVDPDGIGHLPLDALLLLLGGHCSRSTEERFV